MGLTQNESCVFEAQNESCVFEDHKVYFHKPIVPTVHRT